MFIMEGLEHPILLASQNIPVLNFMIPLKVHVIEHTLKELDSCSLSHMPLPKTFSLSLNESTLRSFSHFSRNEIPQSHSIFNVQVEI